MARLELDVGKNNIKWIIFRKLLDTGLTKGVKLPNLDPKRWPLALQEGWPLIRDTLNKKLVDSKENWP
jgi:hypothetical protein